MSTSPASSSLGFSSRTLSAERVDYLLGRLELAGDPARFRVALSVPADAADLLTLVRELDDELADERGRLERERDRRARARGVLDELAESAGTLPRAGAGETSSRPDLLTPPEAAFLAACRRLSARAVARLCGIDTIDGCLAVRTVLRGARAARV